MKPEEAIERLRILRDEAAARLPNSTSSAEFNSWQPTTFNRPRQRSRCQSSAVQYTPVNAMIALALATSLVRAAHSPGDRGRRYDAVGHSLARARSALNGT